MITRHGLYCDNFMARFYDVQLPKPVTDDYHSEPIVLSDTLLNEWDSKATEIVKCETLDYAEWYGEDVDSDVHFPLTILRIQHEDGSFSVEPVYKLFPIKKGNHILLRNAILEYCNVEWDLQDKIEFRKKQENAPIREIYPELPMVTLNLWYERNLQMMYARKYDITMFQTILRTALFTPEQWISEFKGNYDTDFCWLYKP